MPYKGKRNVSNGSDVFYRCGSNVRATLHFLSFPDSGKRTLSCSRGTSESKRILQRQHAAVGIWKTFGERSPGQRQICSEDGTEHVTAESRLHVLKEIV